MSFGGGKLGGVIRRDPLGTIGGQFVVETPVCPKRSSMQPSRTAAYQRQRTVDLFHFRCRRDRTSSLRTRSTQSPSLGRLGRRRRSESCLASQMVH